MQRTPHSIIRYATWLLAALFLPRITWAQIAIGTLPYDPGTTNMNSYAGSAASLPAGWTAVGTYRGTGTGTSTTGGLYGFGSGSDFSLGALRSGSTGTLSYTVTYTNNSGGSITSLTFNWDYRQYRFANNSGWDCAGTGALAGNGTLSGKDFVGSVSGSNGATTPVTSFTLSGLSIANGASFGISWTTTDQAGSDNGVAIDNFRIIASGAPPAPAPAATFAQLTAGPVGSPLVAGSTGQVLFGFSAASTASGSTSPTTQTLTALSLPTTSNTNGSLLNVRLIRSTDNDPSTTADNTTLGTFTQNAGNLQISSIAQALNATAKNYFVVADVEGLVSPSTPTVAISLSNSSTTLSAGSENTFNFSSTTYAFIGSGSPVLDASGIASFGNVCINTDLAPTATFILTGSDLEAGNVTVGPLNGFTFFDPNIFDYSSTLIIPQGGSISLEIAVRFLPTATTSYNGSIPVSGGGGSTAVPVAGVGVDTAPATVTGSASAIGLDEAAISGSVTNLGCSPLISVGVEYSTTNNFVPGTGASVFADDANDTWSAALNGLAPCTTYFVRAFATNNGGTTYGEQASFTTTDPPAPVATAATDIFSTGFTATWEPVDGATSYILDVSTLPNFALENFATDLFFSEYIEASSGNEKYVEIYNGTGTTANLGDYQLLKYTNGSSSPTTIALSGSLPSGQVAVYKHTSATAWPGTANGVSGSLDFNGNDALALRRISTDSYVDIFGRIGEDPGSAWSGGGNSTANSTLQRKSTVTGGVTTNPASGFPTLAAEWNNLGGGNNVSAIGVHTSAVPSVTPSFLPGYQALVVNGTEQPVNGLVLDQTYYYRAQATIGSCISTRSNTVSVGTECDPVVISGTTDNGPICELDQLLLTVEVASGETPYSYSWTGIGSFSPDQTSANVGVTNATSGTYSVTVSNICSDDQADVLINVIDDSDGDGTCDDVDGCPLDPLKLVPGSCGCGAPEPGATCDDGDENTTNDMVGVDCMCAGTPVAPPCTENVTMELRTDNLSSQASWQILLQNTNQVVCQFSVPINGITTPITDNCCLPVGCYRLRVSDSGGDGFVSGGITGGYQLRESGATGRRIIDNLGNFTTGSISAMGGGYDNGAFCVPVGTDRPIFSSCDKTDWVANKFIVATENLAVSAQYNVTNTTSGYEFWFFDPNGTYSFRRFRNHATSDGTGTGATRACHFRINAWANTISTPHLPSNVLLNVRIRGRANNVNAPFGPACLFKIDAARAACPLVSLQDNPLNSDFSCGVNRYFGGANTGGNRIIANPPQPIPTVSSGSVRYQFRFRNGEYPNPEGCIVRPPQTSAQLNLNWSAATGTQLKCNTQYDVDVRVSLDGGATWCVGNASSAPALNCADPGDPSTAWGKVCSVNITTSTNCPGPLQGASSSIAAQQGGDLTLYPNPNRGDLLFISLTEVGADVNTVSVDIYDMTGKRVTARMIAVQDGFVKTNIDLNGDLAGGLYMVNITAGDKTYTERLVIQK